MIRKLAIFVIDITVSVKIPHPPCEYRFSRTVTLPCVVVMGPLFSPATHVGWSAPCRFEYMAVAMGYNTQGVNALTLRRQAPITHVWHCATKWLCHQAWPLHRYAWDLRPSIYLTLCLHGVPSAPYRRTCLAAIILQSNWAFRSLSLSGRLLIGSKAISYHPGFPAKASTGSTWIIMLYVSSIQVSSSEQCPPLILWFFRDWFSYSRNTYG